MTPLVSALFLKSLYAFGVAVILCALATSGRAQWLKVQLPGIPRTTDGKPDMNAPVPKTADGKPDLSGLWAATTRAGFLNLAGEGVVPPLQPWAAALFNARTENAGRDKPQVRCLPHGVPDSRMVQKGVLPYVGQSEIAWSHSRTRRGAEESRDAFSQRSPIFGSKLSRSLPVAIMWSSAWASRPPIKATSPELPPPTNGLASTPVTSWSYETARPFAADSTAIMPRCSSSLVASRWIN